jgi:uncharacterized protein YdaU (DUF1376 family)
MRAAWWWIDRWRKSAAYLSMNLEEQGLYRNLLDAIWLFDDGIIPADEKTLVAASGGDPEAWKRSGKTVLKWMQRRRHGWTNGVALEVIHQSIRRAKNQKAYRERLRSRADNESITNPITEPITEPITGRSQRDHKADSPSIRTNRVVTLDSERTLDRGEGSGEGLSTKPPSNPFIPPGGRPSLESECLNLVHRMSELTGEDPLEIIARASGYEGAKRTKLNPASMTDDRLLNTIRDLRTDVAIEEKKHAEKHT